MVQIIINNWFYMSVKQRHLEYLFYTIALYTSFGKHLPSIFCLDLMFCNGFEIKIEICEPVYVVFQ